MQHMNVIAAGLRRPGLLVRAARAGQQGYRRETHLAAIAPGLETFDAPGSALADLCALEERCEEARRARDAAYSVARHVALMIALLAEMRAASGLRPS